MRNESGDGDGQSALVTGPAMKRVKPRLVLALLLSASLAGIWLSHWAAALANRVTWWAMVVGIGALVGGLYWRLRLFDADRFEDEGSLRAARDRWRRIETTAVWLGAAAGAGGLALGEIAPGNHLGHVGLVASLVAAPVFWLGIVRWDTTEAADRTTVFRTGLFVAAIVALASLARIEAGPDVLRLAVRAGHLGAFSLWLGGALWHNFAVLPVVQTNPSAAAAMKGQARRFRRHLLVALPLLFLTGAYQTVELLGPSLRALVSSPFGHVVTTKLLILTVLTTVVVQGLRRGKAR